MSDRQKSDFSGHHPDASEANNGLFVVGIGASAGGLSALEELFDGLPADSGAAFVVIQHLSPDFKSLMKELLERHTGMVVHRVTEGMELQPNSVYLIPPGKNLTVKSNLLRLEERKRDKNDKHELNFPIDLFFRTLADSYGERAIGVILSGSGSDGTRGLRAINEAGGVALVQDPATAEFDGMPRSAIATGVVNQILAPQELAQLIYQYVVSPSDFLDVESTENSLLTYSSLKKIANLLVETENIDFSHYKTSTLSRRIHRRRLINNCTDIVSYIKLLRNSAEERQILCSDLLINVTHFFRNTSAWEGLENNILPILIEQSKPTEELRFWVAGCSTGEEAYSLAILVYEALQDIDKPLTVKIFATDIDRVALEKASQGIYSQSIANDIAPERLQRYFIPKDNCYQVIRKIREMLIFSPHDLTRDASFTRMHLISCRNVLIYMQSDLQQQILRNLHFSLMVKGVLFLGEAESVGGFESEFNTLDKKWKIYQKRRDIRLPLPLKSIPRIATNSLLHAFKPQISPKTPSIQEQSLQRILKESNSVVLLVSSDHRLLHVYGDSSTIFKPLHGEIVTEVTRMVVLPLQLPLNTALHRAKKEKKSVIYTDIRLEQGEDRYKIKLKVIPPQPNEENGDFYLVKINQQAVSPSPEVDSVEKFQVGDEAQRRILELEYELQHTRENLQALIEELETTNEEQQASNEELTASNEELQSTNEELHSVNEELHTVNIEYQTKIQELTQLNNDIDNLLKSTNIGVIFLDSQLKIRKFTPAATEAISLRYSDLERPLEELTLKIECPQLLELLKEVRSNQQPMELEVKLKESDSYLLMRIYSYQTEERKNEGIVISFVKIDEMKAVQLKLENTLVEKNRQLAAIETASDGIGILNNDKFIYLNQAHLEIFGYNQPEELIGQSWQVLYESEQVAQFEREVFPFLLELGRWHGEIKAKHRDGHTFDEEVTLTLTPGGDLIRVCRDISDRLETERSLRDSKQKLEAANQAKDEFIAHMSHELRTPLHSILGFSNILQKDSRLTLEQLNSVNIVHQSGQHLLTLINHILDLSKLTAKKLQLEPREFNLIPFLNEIVTIFCFRARQKNLKFLGQISPSLPGIVRGDETRLRQVLYNLLTNAVKYTETGSITLKVGYAENFLVNQDQEDSSTPLSKIRFQVEDTGIGIPRHQFAQIFTPFGQLNRDTDNSEGTGLGLAISQKILQLMRSQIQLESEVSQGSKFWFDLELVEVETNILPASPKYNCLLGRCLRQPCKILIVDDNADNRTLLLNYLRQLGFTLAEADNGAVGLAIAQTFEPDAILVDLVMPVMDGKEMIEKIKQQPNLSNCVAIAISAENQSILEPSVIDGHGFLPKPVNLEQLLELLDSHLHLDWNVCQSTPESDNLSNLIVPPQEQLVKLLESVDIGDMKTIEMQISSLEAVDSQYLPFVQEVRQLAASFQLHRLETLINSFISEQ